jgi:hypothetical protein
MAIVLRGLILRQVTGHRHFVWASLSQSIDKGRIEISSSVVGLPSRPVLRNCKNALSNGDAGRRRLSLSRIKTWHPGVMFTDHRSCQQDVEIPACNPLV